MPISITKTKEKAPATIAPPVAAVEPSQLSDEELADRYGSLDDEVNALMSSPVLVRFEEVKKELAKRMQSYEATDEIEIKGKHWMLEVSACSKSPRKVVDNAKVMKFLGKEDFMKIAKVGIGDAEKYLTPEQVAEVASATSYTKNRSTTVKFLG